MSRLLGRRLARWTIAGAVLCALSTGPPTAWAADAESAFKDKIVRIIVGFPPGGGFDTYSRVIGRHLGRHIPGAPTVIVDNMPGAGSLIAAKHLSRVAKPDGLTFGMLHGNQVMAQIVGRQATDVDFRKFEWVGVPVQDTSVCAFTRASGITSLEAWRAARSPVKLGATTPPDSSYLVARVLQAALGLPIQVVRGYKGTADIRLAAEAGEVAGGCWQWESVKVTWRKALDAGEVIVVLQAGAHPHPDLGGVPVANTLASSDEARQLLRVGIEMLSTKTRVYALPPGTPKDRGDPAPRLRRDLEGSSVRRRGQTLTAGHRAALRRSRGRDGGRPVPAAAGAGGPAERSGRAVRTG